MHWSKCGELCILRETTGIRVIDMKSLDFYCHFMEIGIVNASDSICRRLLQ